MSLAACPACRHEVEAHRVMDVCIIDDCVCPEDL